MSDLKGCRSHRWLCEILDCYFTTFPNGTPVSLEIGFRLELPGETCVRIPDIGIVMNNNPVPIKDDDCSYKGIFDLCVESLSHSAKRHITRDTDDKKKEYEGGGVREYYILDARGIETAFYRLDKNGKYRKIRPGKGDIIRSKVLPGFQFRVSDLYRRPSLEEMAEDEIYHKYVFPSYKKIKQRAEQEKQRAEQEKQRAEQEKQRAEQEKQRAEQEKQRAEQAEEQISLAKQRAEQAEKQLTETARRMLDNGLDTALIMKCTGLSAEQIAVLSS
ncbi:MAG: Uma2 family endonuclease, partial [Desulfobacterales bacterium]|nr:Uma2 family endonuclease [Desulfobacterales bacterium]